MFSQNELECLDKIKRANALRAVVWAVVTIIGIYKTIDNTYVFGKAKGALMAEEHCKNSGDE